MSATARLNLPYIAPLQAQKQVTYNEAMAALDQLVQPAVKSRTTTVPPGSPAEGDTYIVAPSATGAWAGKDGKFACWLEGAWSFRTPADGWLAYVVDAGLLAVHQSGAWSDLVLLEDYAEGTWTPALNFGGAAVGMTYASTPAGRYTRIGRTVFATGSLTLTAKGSSTGAATIAGLPFTSANDGIAQSAPVGLASGMSAMSGAVTAILAANANRLSLYQSSNGGGSGLSHSNFSNSAALTFSVVYDV
jgi:hypothetical protein